MKVMVLASKGGSHCNNFCKELDNLGVDHQLYYCDDEPELVKKFGIRHSPNLIVDDEVVFHKQATEHELKQFFNL